MLPRTLSCPRGPTHHLRRRHRCGRRHLDRLARLHQPREGLGRDPRTGAGQRGRARLSAQPSCTGAAVRPTPHRGHGGLGHHQPALLRADPGRRDAGPHVGVHAAPRERGGVAADGVGADPATRAGRRRIPPRSEPTAGREPEADRGPASRGPHEPRGARARQRRAGPRRGLSAGRRPSHLAGSPRARLPRRTAQLLDGCHPLGRSEGGSRAGRDHRSPDRARSPRRSARAGQLRTAP